jgi:hypothetical protein
LSMKMDSKSFKEKEEAEAGNKIIYRFQLIRQSISISVNK